MDDKKEGTNTTYKHERSRPIPFFLAAVSVCDIQAFTENRFAKKGTDRKPRDRQKGSHIRGILMLSMHQKTNKQTNNQTNKTYNKFSTIKWKKQQHKNSVKLSQCMHRSRNQMTKPGEAHSWIMLESVGHSTRCLIVKLFLYVSISWNIFTWLYCMFNVIISTAAFIREQERTLAATTATKSHLLIYRLPVRAENLI